MLWHDQDVSSVGAAHRLEMLARVSVSIAGQHRRGWRWSLAASFAGSEDCRVAGASDSRHLRIYEKEPGRERVVRFEVDWKRLATAGCTVTHAAGKTVASWTLKRAWVASSESLKVSSTLPPSRP
jgi:hypothetical protein